MLINEELAKHGVLLVSVEEPYLDTSTPMGGAILDLITALAQQESDMKSAYISHVSGMAPYGFQSTREPRGELMVVRLVPDPAEAPYVRDMVSWALGGMTASAMARKLNTEGVPTKAADMSARVTARRVRGVSQPLERTTWVSSTVLRIQRQAELAAVRAELEHVREALRTLYVDRQAGFYAGTVGDQMFRESVERLTARGANGRTRGRTGDRRGRHGGDPLGVYGPGG